MSGTPAGVNPAAGHQTYTQVPQFGTPLVDANGNMSIPWYRFFLNLWQLAGGQFTQVPIGAFAKVTDTGQAVVVSSITGETIGVVGTLSSLTAGPGLVLDINDNVGTIELAPLTPGISITPSNTITVEWQAGVVEVIGGGLELSGGDLSADWNAGGVGALAPPLAIVDGTLEVGGVGSGQWNVGTVDGLQTLAAGPTLAIVGNTLSVGGPPLLANMTFVRLVSLTPLTPANVYSNGSAGVGATLVAIANGALSVDGVGVGVGDLLLITGEPTQQNNGIYTVVSPGDASTPYSLIRTPGLDNPTGLAVAQVISGFEGDVNFDTIFTNQNIPPLVIGTDPFLWGNYFNAISPLSLTGTQLELLLGAGFGLAGGTLSADWSAGTVGALGGGLSIAPAGTLTNVNQGTLTLAGATPGTIAPVVGHNSYLVNIGTTSGTVSVGAGDAPGQFLALNIKQGATPHGLVFDSSVIFSTSLPSYSPTLTANFVDVLGLEWNGANWRLAALNQGFAA